MPVRAKDFHHADRCGAYDVAMADGTADNHVHDDAHGHTHAHDHSHDHSHDHASDHSSELAEIGFEAFGVPLVIAAPAQVLPRVEPVLPPGWRSREPAEDDERFVLETPNNVVYRVAGGRGSVSGSSDLQIALEVLDARLRGYIALHAPEHIFVHAGVVGHRERAIVIPGLSFSGKTTLVAELVRAGATYYSDEFAVLDANGLVHPYPKPLSIRGDGYSQVDHSVEALGGSAGKGPLPVGLVVLAQYEPGARWEPRRLSGGEAVLAILANTVPAQERPEQALSTIKRAVDGAVALQSGRGEAAELVRELLDAVPAARGQAP